MTGGGDSGSRMEKCKRDVFLTRTKDPAMPGSRKPAAASLPEGRTCISQRGRRKQVRIRCMHQLASTCARSRALGNHPDAAVRCYRSAGAGEDGRYGVDCRRILQPHRRCHGSSSTVSRWTPPPQTRCGKLTSPDEEACPAGLTGLPPSPTDSRPRSRIGEGRATATGGEDQIRSVSALSSGWAQD